MKKTLVQKLEKGIGKRTLVITENFPFYIVGELKAVGEEYIKIIAESDIGNIIKGNAFVVSIENIASLYVEEVEAEIEKF